MQQAEVEAAGRALARMQQRSPDIDPEVWTVIHCRLQDDAASAASEPTKICSAGCGLAENARMFSKKQWSARAVRRCLDCVQAGGEPKVCAHGKGAFDCAACAKIVKQVFRGAAGPVARGRGSPAAVLEGGVANHRPGAALPRWRPDLELRIAARLRLRPRA